MYSMKYPMYQVQQRHIDLARVELVDRIKYKATFEEEWRSNIIPLLRGTFQAVIMRGIDLDIQQDELSDVLALCAQSGYKPDISAGLDKACEYWQGKLIGQPAVAGTFLMNGYSAYRQLTDEDTPGIVRNLTFYVFSLYLLSVTEMKSGDEYSNLPFITL